MAERAGVHRHPLAVLVPLAGELTSYSRRHLRGDLVAGLAAAAVLVPNAMAYGQVAGLVPTAGLYAALGSAVAYALFTSTRIVAVGPTSTMAILTFTAVHDRANGDPGRALALAAGLSLLTGGVCLAAAVLRLGALGNLLSQPVMLGYLAGSGVVILAGQAKKLVGVSVDSQAAVIQVWQVITHLSQAHLATAALGAGSLAALVLLRRWAPRVPASLVVLLGAVAISTVGGLAERGVALIGAVSPGLPLPSLPALSMADVWALLPAAAGVALIASTEIDATAGSGEPVNADRESAALGASSASAGLLGGFPPAASYSRTASARGAGAQTQVFQLVTAGAVVVALFAGAPLAARLPVTALAAVAMINAARLIDVAGFLRIWHAWRDEAAIALVAAVGVVGLGPLRGLLIAVALAIWELVRRAARPHDAVLAYAGPDQPPQKVDIGASPHPDVLIYRVDAPLFFANAGRIRDRVLALTARSGPQLRSVILDLEPGFYLDSTAAATPARLTVDLRDRGCGLAVARARNAVLSALRSNPYEDGATQRLPAFPSVRDAFVTIRSDGDRSRTETDS